MLTILGESPHGPIKPTALRNNIGRFVVTLGAGPGAVLSEVDARNHFRVEHLSSVLRGFCKVDVPSARVLSICGGRNSIVAASSSRVQSVAEAQAITTEAVLLETTAETGLVVYDGAAYSNFSTSEMVDALVCRGITIDKLKDDKEALRQRVRRAEARAEAAASKFVSTRNGCGTILEHVQYRAGLRNVAPLNGYMLAIRRNVFGNPSRAAATNMLAGDDLAGGLSSDYVLAKYEHLTAASQRCKSVDLHETYDREADASARAIVATMDNGGERDVPPPESQRQFKVCAIHAIQFKGDATHQSCLGEDKMHLATLATIVHNSGVESEPLVMSVPMDDGPEAPRTVLVAENSVVERVKSFCPIQLVPEGTAGELYRRIGQPFQSVGCNAWDDACNQAATTRWYDLGSYFVAAVVCQLFCFGFDDVPDNRGFLRRVRTRLQRFPYLILAINFCFFHQYHLSIKSMLCVLDGTAPWCPDADDEEFRFRAKYFSSLATIANVWMGARCAEQTYDCR